MTTLWYRQPAEEWEEALPLGNGRLGAMVFGGVPRERIQLNEESLWAGEPLDVYPQDFALRATALDSANWTYANRLGRAYMAAGDLAAATNTFQRALSSAPYAAEPHLHLSRIFQRQGRRQETERERAIHDRLDLEKQNLLSALHLLRSDPDDVQKLRFVGSTYVKQRKFRSASRYFERLVELQQARSPISRWVSSSIGWASWKLQSPLIGRRIG